MRSVIQRVVHASVSIKEEITGQIKKGLLVFLGIEEADSMEDLQWLSNKIIHMRLFNDENGVMNRSLLDISGDLLLVSQFTLHAAIKKGNRPSYIKAANPAVANPIYEKMIVQLQNDLGKKIATGRFGADMQVTLTNDGPVTIWIDTKNRS